MDWPTQRSGAKTVPLPSTTTMLVPSATGTRASACPIQDRSMPSASTARTPSSAPSNGSAIATTLLPLVRPTIWSLTTMRRAETASRNQARSATGGEGASAEEHSTLPSAE